MTVSSRSRAVRVLAILAIPLMIPCATPALAQQRAPVGPSVAPPAVPQVPNQAVQIMLVQSALAALNQANLADDYSLLLKNASVGFRQTNNQAQLSAAFRSFRDNGIDLSPAVLFLPRWDTPTAMEGSALHLIGTIPSRPSHVGFDVQFVVEGGRWRLASLSVKLVAAATNGAQQPGTR